MIVVTVEPDDSEDDETGELLYTDMNESCYFRYQVIPPADLNFDADPLKYGSTIWTTEWIEDDFTLSQFADMAFYYFEAGQNVSEAKPLDVTLALRRITEVVEDSTNDDD